MACAARLATGRSGPANTTALSPLGRAVAAAATVVVVCSCGGLRSTRSSSWLGAAARSNSHSSRTAAEVTLSSQDHVVEACSELQTGGGPGVEVGSDIDGSRASLVPSNGPELLEGRSSIDRWLVGSGADQDVVNTAVDCDGSFVGSTGRWVVGTEVLNDVVLNQRAPGPSVDGKVGVTVWIVVAGVGNGSATTWSPSLSTDEVSTRLPDNAVCATSKVGVGDVGATVSPPRVVVSIVGTSGAWSSSTREKGSVVRSKSRGG